MGKTTEEKSLLAGRLVKEMREASIPLEDVYIDPLIFPVAADNSSALATLAAIAKIKAQFPEVHTICGLTNISHGLPRRKLVNRAFLVAAVSHGLDAVIMDPTDKELYGALKASIMIMGGDDFCMGYIKAFRQGRLG